MFRRRYTCGPVAVDVAAPTAALHDKVAETLHLYTVRWPKVSRRTEICIRRTPEPAVMRAGTFLTCGRMHVDLSGTKVKATCRSGAFAVSSECRGQWTIGVPRHTHTGEEIPEDIEDLVGLVLTTGWRDLNMVPVHAGSVVRNGTCALLCATSGGGKTTLTAAMIRRGWRTLGDDKLLLTVDGEGHPHLASLIHNFNLHPNTRTWFPEVGDLTRLPRYSAWTEKRKVRIEDIWPAATMEHGCPTHLLELKRTPEMTGIELVPMPQGAILPTLLRQTVIPRDKVLAGRILAMLAATARHLTGFQAMLGNDLYTDPSLLDVVEETLH
jgi:hypothetical protein